MLMKCTKFDKHTREGFLFKNLAQKAKIMSYSSDLFLNKFNVKFFLNVDFAYFFYEHQSGVLLMSIDSHIFCSK